MFNKLERLLPVYSGACQNGPPAPNDPAEVTNEGHGSALQDHLGGGQVDEVVVGQAGIVAVSPHVGDEVCVEVRVTESDIKSNINHGYWFCYICT